MKLERYLQRRRRWEVLIAVSLIGISAVANVLIALIDSERVGTGMNAWEPWILELTSNLAILALIPLIIWFDHRFPLMIRSWRRSVPAHVLFSVVFSLAHVTLMYWARVVVFEKVFDVGYRWDDWLGEFGYEYLKDFRTYLLILSGIYLYRFILLRLRGEAGFIDEQPEAESSPAVERFIVKKLGREFLVRATDIEWIESAGNYVNLHVNGKVYPLRDTMAHISDVLAPKGFIRIHRSAIINLDCVEEIDTSDSGDGVVRLRTKTSVPISRRYRQALREAVAT